MKRLLPVSVGLVLSMLLSGCISAGHCAITGKFNLGAPAQGFILRDAYNGQWRAGYDKPLWELDLNGKELFYIGFAHTWNAQHGNSALGPTLGKHVTTAQIAILSAAALNLPDTSVPPFISYIGHILSVNGNVSYMPVHTEDVRGPVIYGVGATLDLSDLFGLLQKGL